MPGPHKGTGRPAVADWWLENGCFGVEETEAAAATGNDDGQDETRKASFIIGYPSQKSLQNFLGLLTLLW